MTPLGWLCAFLIGFVALTPTVEARLTYTLAAIATP